MTSPRIAAIGLASWDQLLLVDHYPQPGEYRIVLQQESLPGGTTTNLAIALARLGATVSLRAVVGDDEPGKHLVAELERAGVDTGMITTRDGEPTDASTIIVSRKPFDRTIYWHVGAAIRKGDLLDIWHLFGQDVLVLDIADHPLRRFLTDLPAHSVPAVRMLGTLTYLVESGQPDELDVAFRFDTLVGNEREFQVLTGASSPATALEFVQNRMPGTNLRTAVMSGGDSGCRIATRDQQWQVPAFDVDVLDATGAGDAFAAGIAWGMALRWPWERTGTFANALGALATRGFGAQVTLPTWDEVMELIESQGRGAILDT